VKEAYELLMPAPVKEALAAGVDVKRQGEFFFVPVSRGEVLRLTFGNDKKIEELKKTIKSNRKTGRDDAVKALSFLTMLKQHNLKPADMLLSKVPIIPAQYRPVMVQGDQALTADVNELYKDLMLVNKSYGEAKDFPEVDKELLDTAKKQLEALNKT
jgi:DNA-directed RNA polymerase beta' subunit